jgi:hypothetical protein
LTACALHERADARAGSTANRRIKQAGQASSAATDAEELITQPVAADPRGRVTVVAGYLIRRGSE